MRAGRGARAFANDIVLSYLIKVATELYPDVPVCMHQDHGKSPATCMSAIASGFSPVMMDGSLSEDGATPTTFDEYVVVTAKVVEMAHLVGISVEGETGHLGCLETGRSEFEDGHGFEGALSKDMLSTDPDESARFVALTKVDALTVTIGTSHGASSIPEEVQEIINANGGDIKPTWRVSVEEI
ncbi:MAG: class II fructose-bisphosphate aldolase [Pseudoruegeria sp.]